jgi:hypothetical protein
MSTFYTFKYSNVIEMKNKPDPALLRTPFISNGIKKKIPKSRETIPLTLLRLLMQERTYM